MRRFLLPTLTAALLVPAHALEVAAPLTLLPSATGVNRFNVNITASVATGSSTTNASGMMNVRMQVDPATGKVSSLSFEQGRILFSNMSIPLRAFGLLPVANITTSGLEGFAWTPAPPAPVTPATGNFDASLHNFTVDRGQVNGATTAAIGDIPAGTTFGNNFTETPLTGPAEGTGTLTLTEIPAQATAATRTWKTSLLLPLNIVQTTDLDGTAVTIRLTGNLRAESNIAIPRNEYFAWTIANNLPAPAFDAEARPGEPYGMLWAIGLAPTASLKPHLPAILLAGGPHALMPLPPTGTAAPLLIEVSDRLATGSWAPAPPATVTGGLNPLPSGTKGTITVQLSGPNQFVRLRSTAP